jgi:hypothetical protein
LKARGEAILAKVDRAIPKEWIEIHQQRQKDGGGKENRRWNLR